MSRQRLGQHFLRSSAVLRRIVDALRATPEDLVLEIGPGQGALTRVLLDAGLRVEAIEVDSELVRQLEETWPPASSGLRVHHQDVLEADLRQWGPVMVAGNLPYYITSPILRSLFAMGSSMRTGVLLMQREVAERLVAKPGTRDYGFLSALTQWHSRPELLFRVPPGAFHIPPKVDSAVVRLTPAPSLLVQQTHAAQFESFLGWCFAQKRKTLRNNLRAYVNPEVLASLREGPLRAEQLSVPEFATLFEHLWEQGAWKNEIFGQASRAIPSHTNGSTED